MASRHAGSEAAVSSRGSSRHCSRHAMMFTHAKKRPMALARAPVSGMLSRRPLKCDACDVRVDVFR
jgi:hypothetical protein